MVTDKEIEDAVALTCREMIDSLQARGYSSKEAIHSVYVVHQSMIISHIKIALMLKEHRAKKAQDNKPKSLFVNQFTDSIKE